MNKNSKTNIATFGSGCFWGVEERFRQVDGVLETAVGYMGGHTENPTYDEVCTDKTGHAEVVQIKYNPAFVSYDELLNIFWHSHDPTQMDRQGADIGTQYRSVIFYSDGKQKKFAEKSKIAVDKSNRYSSSVVTKIVEAGKFCKAEEYHQKYLAKRGQSSCGV